MPRRQNAKPRHRMRARRWRLARYAAMSPQELVDSILALTSDWQPPAYAEAIMYADPDAVCFPARTGMDAFDAIREGIARDNKERGLGVRRVPRPSGQFAVPVTDEEIVEWRAFRASQSMSARATRTVLRTLTVIDEASGVPPEVTELTESSLRSVGDFVDYLRGEKE